MAYEIKQNLSVLGSIITPRATGNLFIEQDSGASTNPYIQFGRSGTEAQILSEATNLNIRRGVGTNSLRMFDTYSVFSSVVRGITPVGTTDLTTKAYVDDNFLNKTKNQTFSGDLTINDVNDTYLTIESDTGVPLITFQVGATEVGRLQVNASQAFLRHTHSAAGAHTELKLYDDYLLASKVIRALDPVGLTDLTTLSYVEDNFIANNTSATQGLDGDLAVTNTSGSSRITVSSTGTNLGQYRMNNDGLIRGLLYSDGAGSVKLRYYDQPNAPTQSFDVGSEIELGEDYISVTAPIIGQDPTIGSHLTTRDYVNDNFVDLTTNQAIAGAKSFTDNTTIFKATPILNLTDTGTGDPQLRMSSEGVLSMHMYYAHTSDTVSIIKKDTTGRVGGGTSHSISITTDNVRFLSGGGHGHHIIDGAAGNNAYTEWKVGGVRRAILSAFDTTTVLTHENGADDTALSLRDDYADFNKDLRIATMGTAVDSATTKAYVDDNFVDITTTQNIGGAKTFTDDMLLKKATPNFKIRKNAATDAMHLVFADESGITTAEMTVDGSADSNIRLMHRDGGTVNNTFFMNATYSSFSNDVRLNTTQGTAGSSLTRRDYVDDNDNVVQQTAGYQFVMPTATPTAGQQLQVGSVSGTTVTMVWV